MNLRDLPRDVALIILATIIANVTSNMFHPFLSLYLETLGATLQQIGIFFTVETIMAISFRILGGWISDSFGRMPTIAMGSIFGLLAYVGYTLAPTWGWVMLGALMGAAGGSLVAPSYQALIAESAPEGQTASTFGLIDGLYLTCQIIGPLLGGFLIEQYSFKVMMWVAVGIFVVATTMRVLVARHTPFKVRPRDLKARQLKTDLLSMVGIIFAGGIVTWLFIIDGMRDASFQAVMPFLPVYVTEIGGFGETFYGGLTAGMSVVTALLLFPAGMFADRYGERWGIALAGIPMILSVAVIALFPVRLGFIVGFGLFGIAGAILSPAFSSLLSKSVPKESLGITYGIFWSALGIAAIPMPYLGGLLYDSVGPTTPFWVAAVMTALSIPLALWKLKRPPGEAAAESAEPVVGAADPLPETEVM